jgi:hypothetical protein
MKREDFVCTIGYQGDTAIVDGVAKRRYGKKSAEELLEQGLYRYAFCAALYDGTVDAVVPKMAESTGFGVDSVEGFKRLFGVFEVPERVTKVSVIS